MAAEKGTCPVEGFYRGIGSYVCFKFYDLSYTRDPTLLSGFLYKNP